MYSSAKSITIYKDRILSYLRDDKLTVNDPNKWDLPGVDLEEDETFAGAMRRAFSEQFGLNPRSIELLGKIGNNLGYEHAIFLTKLTDAEVKGIRLGNRGQCYKFLSVQELIRAGLTRPLHLYFTNHITPLENLVAGKRVKKEDLSLY